MAPGSANQPEASGQIPLAELVMRRRREMALSQGEVARLMQKAAKETGGSCPANRQAVSEYEHGRIPHPCTLRLLASALGVSLEEAQTAADHQRAHRQMLRAAKTILGDSAGSGWPPEPSTKGASIPGANRDAAGGCQRAQIVIAFPDSGYPWLASSNDATLGASDTLVVAISQSGTTTDTNRTVDLVRARGAAVLAVVNRRNSDLVEKADGVLYTSDGRDVEMSVASTKAFYAQVAAGFLLSLAIAREIRAGPNAAAGRLEHELLAGLRDLPSALEEVLAARPEIAAAAWAHAPGRRHWAVVGNGPNRLTALELRIKLSELAYKSIACDATEDKKHIDLSSEPLILVCAAGLPPAAAADVGKELAIYRAHKAAPVVIATRGTAFPSALATIEVPANHHGTSRPERKNSLVLPRARRA